MNPRTLDIRKTLIATLAAGSLIAALSDAHADGLEIERQKGVAFVNGGIGDREQRRIQKLGEDMNLKMIFALQSGAYVADVDVVVIDGTGETVLKLASAEPLLYADLEPGRYEVIAQYDGRSLERTVSVPKRGQEAMYFTWN